MPYQQFHVLDDAANSRYILVDVGDEETISRAEPGGESQVIQAGLIDYVDVRGADATERVLVHTEVDPSYEGHGLASVLAKGALDSITSHGYRVVPVCPYIAAWLPRHPEFAAITIRPDSRHLRAVAELP